MHDENPFSFDITKIGYAVSYNLYLLLASTSIKACLMTNQFNKVFSEVKNIPQIPEVIRELIKQLNNPDIEIKDIAQNVEKEQLISLKVLRLVNSASFGLRKKVSSIEEAVIMLGMSKLKTLVIASGIVSSIGKIEHFEMNAFWLESFSTANYSKWLAAHCDCHADITFTAGLLSNLGRLLIYMALPKEAEDIDQRIAAGHQRLFIEKMRLGFSSQEVSAELCRRWKFPDELIIPVAQCGEPLLAKPVSKTACIIYLSRLLSSCKQASMPEEDIISLLNNDISLQLPFAEDFFVQNINQLISLESGLEALLD